MKTHHHTPTALPHHKRKGRVTVHGRGNPIDANFSDESAHEAGRGQAIAPTMLRWISWRSPSIVGAMACPRPVHHFAWLANALSSRLWAAAPLRGPGGVPQSLFSFAP